MIPLVSIACITYNHAPYIRQCLDGFLMQQCDFEYEILIHDDASTDGTQEIIKEYQEKYPHVFKPVFQTENQFSQGVRGIAARFVYPRAQGKYIALCEGDDYWTDPLKLQKQVDFMEANPEVSLSAENGLVKNSVSNSEYLFNKTEMECFYEIKDLLESRKFPTASVLFRKEDLKEAEIGGDTILWVYLATKGKVHYNPVVSSVYNRGNHGVVMGSDKLRWALEMENWNKRMKKMILESKIPFDFAIFNERNFGEFYHAYKTTSFRKQPYKKLLTLLKCFKYKPKRTLKKML